MESNNNLLERYVVYSHKEKAYISYFRTYYKGGCDFTNNIEKATQKYTALELKELILDCEVEYCEIIKVYVLSDEF